MTDSIVIPSAGVPMLLDWMLRAPISGVLDPQLMLFQNEMDPECEVSFGELTECDFDGYARVTLNRSEWQSPTVEQCCAIMLYGSAPISWTNVGSAQQVAGYAFVYPSGSVLLAVQALSLPIDLVTFGTLSIRPQFTLTTGACSLV